MKLMVIRSWSEQRDEVDAKLSQAYGTYYSHAPSKKPNERFFREQHQKSRVKWENFLEPKYKSRNQPTPKKYTNATIKF